MGATRHIPTALVLLLILLTLQPPPATRGQTFNDIRYKGVGLQTCVPSARVRCNRPCNSTAGTDGRYLVPIRCTTQTSVRRVTTPYCASNAITRVQCCLKCVNAGSCAYWQHIIPPSPVCAGCGMCVIYPAAAAAPACATANITVKKVVRLNANVSTVGTPCGSTKNDPHFRGAHGTRFEFNGAPEKSYCLLTDSSLHVNMKMRGYYDTRTIGASLLRNGLAVRTWIRELGVVWREPFAEGARMAEAAGGAEAAEGEDEAKEEAEGEREGGNGVAELPVGGLRRKHTLRLVARDGKGQGRTEGGRLLRLVELDGKAMPELEPGHRHSFPGFSFSFEAEESVGEGFFQVDSYRLTVDSLLDVQIKLRVAHPLLQTTTDAQAHINLHFSHIKPSPRMHGVLGQTYRSGRERRAMDFSALAVLLGHPIAAEGEEGRGFLDGRTEDYETSEVMKTDCVYSSFDRKNLPADIV
ncbi:unnamed protein product [Closterium sp. NIES-54]